MGCVYACVCSGRCWTCSQYEPEQYFGHAEDVLAQSKGFASDDELRHHQQMERQQEEEYYRQMEEFYNSQEQEREQQ